MTRTTDARALPHNREAEESVIGAMLISPRAVEEVWRELSAGDFFAPAHQDIFAAVVALRASGAPIDAVTASEELRRAGKLDDVGGTETLLRLVAATPATSNVKRYAAIVMETAALRAVIAAGAEIGDLGYSATDPDEAITRAQARLAAVRRPKAYAPLDLMTVEDFVAMEADVQRPWVVPDGLDGSPSQPRGLLREGHRGIIVGPEGRGKGVLLRQFALAVSQGRHPFALDVCIPALPTLYADLENPPGAVLHQIKLSMPQLAAVNGGWRPGMAHILARENGMDLRRRADRAELEACIERVRPKLVVIGPVYKAFRKKSGEDFGEVAAEAIEFLDYLRIRYSTALLLEAHASKGSGGHRDMDPAGSQQWMAAPEFGRSMIPAGEKDDRWGRVELRPFRGDREPANWPTHLVRRTYPNAAYLPWIGVWENGGRPAPNDPAMMTADQF